MNKTYDEGMALVDGLLEHMPAHKCHVVLCAPAPYLHAAGNRVSKHKCVFVAGQDCSAHVSGAYTGEVAAPMLASVGCKYVVVGHSERREFHREGPEELAQKTDRALEAGLIPIFCCGEPLKIRESGKHLAFVRKQLKASLSHLIPDQALQIVVAYEPIWAIGTGLTASPEQAQEMHEAIRKLMGTMWGKRVANKISILYGGSVNPGNAHALFAQADVDGGLVGGASLKASDFHAIIAALG